MRVKVRERRWGELLVAGFCGALLVLSGVILCLTLAGITTDPAVAALQAAPWAMLLASGLASVAGLAVHRYGVVRAGLVLAGLWIALTAETMLAQRHAARVEEPSIRVAAANVLFENETNAAAARSVFAQGAEVVVTVETDEDGRAALVSALPGGWREVARGRGGLGEMVSVWSGLEVLERRLYPVGGFELPLVRLDTPDRAVWVLGVHLISPVNKGRIEQWHKSLVALGTLGCGHGEPLVMAGDFNTSMWHPGMREVTRCAADSAGAAGKLWVRTWSPGSSGVLGLPVLGIDHVLVSGAGISGYEEFEIPGSDHRGVLAGVVGEDPRKPG